VRSALGASKEDQDLAETSRAQRFFDMKQAGTPIVMLTAYDAPTAKAEWDAGVDILLVGDSVGTNILGYASEREVTLADICHHTSAVRRGAAEAFILADLPYNTYETPEAAVTHARALIAAGADMVKFEGARPAIVAALVAAKISVCCHLGLEPQHHEDKRVKGRSAADAVALIEAATVLDRAGMSMLILELVPEEVAAKITSRVAAPTIGIGAGRKTDGQVLVVTDLLGATGNNFRHNKRYAEAGTLQGTAYRAYVEEVRRRAFPAEANLIHMSEEELAIFMSEAT
jgi:3-methyl-2-oxobutanoate hydroxymethyltransferase